MICRIHGCEGKRLYGRTVCSTHLREPLDTDPLYCTCDTPDINVNDQCDNCLRAHKSTVFARYGWSL